MAEYLYLDLREGHGNLLGLYWELNSPSLGEYWTLNTGASPNAVKESTLSQILQGTPHPKYYLSRTACLGILRRAEARGKGLPPQLKLALEIQAGSIGQKYQPMTMDAYHINQRDEGVELEGISGTLMATRKIQMQTFVTQELMAFAANQRDEVRNIGGCSGTLQAQPGMKQQTFIAVPPVLCINDQGGQCMDLSEDVCGTLRSQMGGHLPVVLDSNLGVSEIDGYCYPAVTAGLENHGNNQPILFENHGIDSRYTGPHKVAPTISASYGTGGNNTPLISSHMAGSYCIAGNIIDRETHNGGNGFGYQPDISYTLNTADSHAVFSQQRSDGYLESGVASTQAARQCKDATDLVYEVAGLDCRNGGENGDLCGTLQSKATGGYSLNSVHPVRTGNLIRRLTPLECERLQGFPDGWTDIAKGSDSARYKALGNSVAIPCVEFVMRGIAYFLSKPINERL